MKMDILTRFREDWIKTVPTQGTRGLTYVIYRTGQDIA